jgi:hypothetical protein
MARLAERKEHLKLGSKGCLAMKLYVSLGRMPEKRHSLHEFEKGKSGGLKEDYQRITCVTQRS